MAASAATAKKLAPAVIVGGGRVGRALQEMGNGEDLLVKRGEAVPVDFEGPILVCTRNDDLDAVLEATPQSRWKGRNFRMPYESFSEPNFQLELNQEYRNLGGYVLASPEFGLIKFDFISLDRKVRTLPRLKNPYIIKLSDVLGV